MGQFEHRHGFDEFVSSCLRGALAFARNERGNIAVIVALLIIPVAGLLSLAGEVSGWYAIQRAEQNAADSAAIAAAGNGDVNGTPPPYQREAWSVASYMNFANGQHNTTVTAAPTFCPTTSLAECYKVTISKNVSLYLVQIVGYKGSGGTGLETISASAVAGTKNITQPLCLTALSTTASGATITINGGPNVDMTGCAIGVKSTDSNAVKCTGNWSFPVAVAGKGAGCGSATPYDNGRVIDNYSGWGPAYVPASTCPNYNGTTWSGAPGSYTVCGPLTLNGDVTLTTSGVIYIYNGQVDLNGHTLSTAPGTTVTIVLDKVSGSDYAPFSGSSGMLNIQAPATGTWSGIALYQFGLGGNVSQTFNGSNSVQWAITGLIYLPKVDLQFNGTVNNSTYGVACTVLVVDTFRINGGDSLTLKQAADACPLAGLKNPPAIITKSYVALAG